MMGDYLTLKLIHIVSATVLFGTGLGTAFAMWRADVSGDIRRHRRGLPQTSSLPTGCLHCRLSSSSR